MYEHGFAYARSVTFYNNTLLWQWMRLPGDVVFAARALLMVWDFISKLGPLYPALARRLNIIRLCELRGACRVSRERAVWVQQEAFSSEASRTRN